MVGKPVIAGTRIPVEKVLAQLAYKPDLDELFEIYPELTIEDVQALSICVFPNGAIREVPPPGRCAPSL
jgi:uncharacterized protein (DUF433 family)